MTDLRHPPSAMRFVLFLVLLAATVGLATAQEQNDTAYRIGPEDILEVVVWKNTEVSRTVPVRPDGMISLPLVNDVRAAGLTPMQLRDVLIKGLADYIPNAEVTVIVTQVRSFKVSVLGEVANPSRYQLQSRATVLDALAMAGGFREFAKRSRIVILRQDGDTMRRLRFDYDDVVDGDAGAENFVLQPDDIILVP
jgi:polysaccharide export outer membrane protein